MENPSTKDMYNEENLRGQQQNNDYERQEALDAEGWEEGYNAKASGDDIISEGLDKKHHQQHGNRKYESYSNHSSADDQPGNTTDTNLGREHDF